MGLVEKLGRLAKQNEPTTSGDREVLSTTVLEHLVFKYRHHEGDALVMALNDVERQVAELEEEREGVRCAIHGLSGITGVTSAAAVVLGAGAPGLALLGLTGATWWLVARMGKPSNFDQIEGEKFLWERCPRFRSWIERAMISGDYSAGQIVSAYNAFCREVYRLDERTRTKIAVEGGFSRALSHSADRFSGAGAHRVVGGEVRKLAAPLPDDYEEQNGFFASPAPMGAPMDAPMEQAPQNRALPPQTNSPESSGEIPADILGEIAAMAEQQTQQPQLPAPSPDPWALPSGESDDDRHADVAIATEQAIAALKQRDLPAPVVATATGMEREYGNAVVEAREKTARITAASSAYERIMANPFDSRFFIGGQRTGKSYLVACCANQAPVDVYHINLASNIDAEEDTEDERYWQGAVRTLACKLGKLNKQEADQKIGEAIEIFEAFRDAKNASVLVVDEWCEIGSTYFRHKKAIEDLIMMLASEFNSLSSTGMKQKKAIWAIAPNLVADNLVKPAKVVKGGELCYVTIAPGRTVDWNGIPVGFKAELLDQVNSNYPALKIQHPGSRWTMDRIAWCQGGWVPVGELPKL